MFNSSSTASGAGALLNSKNSSSCLITKGVSKSPGEILCDFLCFTYASSPSMSFEYSSNFNSSSESTRGSGEIPFLDGHTFVWFMGLALVDTTAK